nr:hypothetical protein [Tanacetum cinerariifolium]
MTRSSTKELLTPFKVPEREFRSSRKLFKTLSLDEARSPLDLFFDLEENSEEEVMKAMAENMEQYMSKTRADYGSGIAKPKIDDKYHFVLKGQFLKELRDNTFSGSEHEDANEHIEKVLEIVDLFHEVLLFYNGLDVPTRQILDSKAQLNNLGREIKKVNEKVYAAQVGCVQCKGPHYTKDCPLKEEGKPLEEAYYTQFGIPFQGWEYRAAAPGFYQRNNANPSYQEQKQSMEESLSKFMSDSAKRHEENSNLIKEIQASTDAAIRNQGAFLKNLKIQIEQMSKVLPERVFGSLRASISVKPLSTYLNLGLGEFAHTKLTVKLADRTVKYPKGIAKNVLVEIGKFVLPVDFVILDMPEDVKVPLILGRTFFSTVYAKIDVFKRKITLRVRDEKIVFKSMKHASSLIKRVYMLGLRERMELDLKARLMAETLVLNRYGDYIKLNDRNVPLELRKEQVDDLMPTIEECEVIDEPMIDIIKTRNNEIVENINCYRDQDMGDIILREPFCKASCVEARRFDGLITIHNDLSIRRIPAHDTAYSAV